jgi:hypothetical protein
LLNIDELISFDTTIVKDTEWFFCNFRLKEGREGGEEGDRKRENNSVNGKE